MRNLPIKDIMYAAMIRAQAGSESLVIVERSEDDASFYNFSFGWPEEVRVSREGESYTLTHSIPDSIAKRRNELALSAALHPRGIWKYIFLDNKTPTDKRKDILQSPALSTTSESEIRGILTDFASVFAQERKITRYSA